MYFKKITLVLLEDILEEKEMGRGVQLEDWYGGHEKGQLGHSIVKQRRT